MGIRHTLGTIIILLATIGFLIQGSLLGLTFAECELGINILPNTDLSKCGEAYLNFGIGTVSTLVWIGLGVLIRGKKREVFI